MIYTTGMTLLESVNIYRCLCSEHTSIWTSNSAKGRSWKKLLSLGALAKLRKAATRFAMYVRPSAWNYSAPKGGILIKIWFLSALRKYFEKVQAALKSAKNNGHFTLTLEVRFWSHLAHFFLEWEMFRLYRKSKCAFYNLMFFWPCIMNWLYINYQLDALIIIYS